jgi:hypothetical protein
VCFPRNPDFHQNVNTFPHKVTSLHEKEHVTMTATTAVEERRAFDKTTKAGKEHGLFRASMNSIRSAHVRANRLRAGLVLAGLFTDAAIYREILAIFYAVTKQLEIKLKSLEKKDEICAKITALGYRFTDDYEKDMATLFGKETWEQNVEMVVSRHSAALVYVTKIQNMTTGMELAGAVFCLWGALIIGGGALAMPRVKSLCGKDAIHVFEQVTGPGREERKTTFANVWDSLAAPGSSEFDEIVNQCRECMQCNNNIFTSLQRNPWWLYYMVAVSVGLIAIVFVLIQRRWSQ